MDSWVVGLVASLGAGLATGLGGLPILFVQKFSDRLQGILLGFGAGMMLAASAFSLLVPGKDVAIAAGASEVQAAGIICLGLAVGGGVLWLANENFPHEHFSSKGVQGRQVNPNWQRIWLFVIAIAIHNFPEGLAVGVSFGNEELAPALALAGGIGLQNIPEGFAVAASLRELNYSARYAVLISLLTGLVEPVGGALGVGVVSFSQAFLPWSMAFAAGAMLFVIVDEIIPDIDEKSCAQEGTLGILSGFLVMMFLDTALG